MTPLGGEIFATDREPDYLLPTGGGEIISLYVPGFPSRSIGMGEGRRKGEKKIKTRKTYWD